jgi:hypothetical protein
MYIKAPLLGNIFSSEPALQEWHEIAFQQVSWFLPLMPYRQVPQRCLVDILAETLVILTEVFVFFLNPYLHADTSIGPQVGDKHFQILSI